MKTTRTVRTLLVLTALGTLLSAQTPPAKKPEPKKPEPAHAAPAPEKPKEAAAKPESKSEGRELSIAVTGLTKDNLAAVKESLQKLSTKAFVCEACKESKDAAGNCPKCQAPLKPMSQPDFTAIQPSAEGNTVALTLDPKATVKLSEIESTLGKSSVKIDANKFTIGGMARLVVKGATADAAPTIEKALTDAKLFDMVKAQFDASTNELTVMVKAGATAPTRAKVQSAIEGAKAQLGDVVWGPMGQKKA